MKSYLARLIARAAPTPAQPRQDSGSPESLSRRGQEPDSGEIPDPFEESLQMPESPVQPPARLAEPAPLMPPSSQHSPEVTSAPLPPISSDDPRSLERPDERTPSDIGSLRNSKQTSLPSRVPEDDWRPETDLPSIEEPDAIGTIERPLARDEAEESRQAEALRIADRFMERILEARVPDLEPAPVMGLSAPDKPASDQAERVTPSLQPAPAPAATVDSPDSPLLTIGRLRVDVIPAVPQQAPAPRVVIRRPTIAQERPAPATPPSVMRFGLRQV